jgi:dihydropteroate synthase
MGICNVTPDSFADGGKWRAADAAVAHAESLVAEGADLIDVGGESTRPGASRVSQAEELRRVLPVIKRLAKVGVKVCVDTMRAAVALRAADAGACLVNDVSGGLADPAMLRAVAELGLPCVLGHWPGAPRHLGDSPPNQVPVDLVARLAEAIAAGISQAKIVLDPGLGFGKLGQANWQTLAQIDRLTALNRPILIGASRKRFLAESLAGGDGMELVPYLVPTDNDQAKPVIDDLMLGRLDAATAVVSGLSALAGVWCVRVHQVALSRDAVEIGRKWCAGSIE